MKEFIVWLEANIMLVMLAVAVVMILFSLVVAIVKGKKRNKKYEKEIAKKEGEQAASVAFAEKEIVAESIVEDKEQIQEVQPIEEIKEEPQKVAEEQVSDKEQILDKEEKVVVKAKSTTKSTKKESTFSPRKKSITVIEPEYVTESKKVEKTEKVKAKTVQKQEPIKESEEEVQIEEKISKTAGGKWEIHKNGNSYYYLLRAQNGEVLATSEAYSTQDGAKNGINTLKRNIEGGDVRIEEDKNENFCFKLTSRPPFPRLLCVGQSYKYKKSAEGSFEAVKRLATQDIPVTLVIDEDSEQFEEVVVDVKLVTPSSLPGKWEISQRENGKFGVLLRASNGVLVLSGEPRATEEGCVDYIEKIKNTLKTGTVKVQEDKNGQFCYKLYSVQKRIVCVGEKYSTMQSAIKSAESLARFAENATIVSNVAKKED